MGNSSCYFSWLTAFRERCPKDKAKVLDSEGHLTFVELPMSVLDLMSDNPDFAVCAAEDIRQTHRLVRMNINQWLTPRKLYLLVPMHKVDSKVSDVQLAAVHSVCSGKKKLVPGDDYRDFLKGLFGNVNGHVKVDATTIGPLLLQPSMKTVQFDSNNCMASSILNSISGFVHNR